MPHAANCSHLLGVETSGRINVLGTKFPQWDQLDGLSAGRWECPFKRRNQKIIHSQKNRNLWQRVVGESNRDKFWATVLCEMLVRFTKFAFEHPEKRHAVDLKDLVPSGTTHRNINRVT